MHEEELKLYTGHWQAVKDRINSGTSHVCLLPTGVVERCTDSIGFLKPCFGVDVFLAQKKEGFSDEQAAYITGSLLEGGSDTTSGILVGFIQAMMVTPEVQKRAQEDIDRVVGPDRMPVMEDAANLQYIRAIVKESIRWMPTLILGSPHAVIRDDYYMGYRIPEGTTVINNNW